MITNQNYVELSGRLTKDIVLKVSKDNHEYGIISIAINKFHNDEQGNLKYQTAFFDVFIWRPMLLELYGEILKKGVSVIVRAELTQYEGRVVINVIDQNGISVLQNLRSKKEVDDIYEAEQPESQSYGGMATSEAELNDLVN